MAGRADRLERLTNLVALLLSTRRPLSLEEIADELPDGSYPDDPRNRHAAFERDKRTLREQGVPLRTESQPDGRAGYRIDPVEYQLPPLALGDDELVALRLAAAAVPVGPGWSEEALWKLGAGAEPGDAPLALLPAAGALPTLFDARRRRATARFRYRGTDRELEPHGLLFRDGAWYVTGIDRSRGERRTFRVDRIEGEVTVGPPGAFEPPVGFDAASALPAAPWDLGDAEPVEAHVRVDRLRAAKVVRELGEAAVVEREAGGAVVVRLAVRHPEAFRSWVLGLLDHAVVLGPPALVDDLTGWLQAVARP